MPRPRLIAPFLLVSLFSTAGAASQSAPQQRPKPKPPASAQNPPEDVPSMSSSDSVGVPSRYNSRTPLPPSLTLAQLGSYASDHIYDDYTIAGLRLLAVRNTSQDRYSTGPYPIDVHEPASETTLYGLSSIAFSFYTSNSNFAREIKARIPLYKKNEVRLVFKFTSRYVGRNTQGYAGEVSRVYWLDEKGHAVDEVFADMY